MKKKYTILLIAIFLINFSTQAQTSDELWSKSSVSAKQATKKLKRDTLPDKFNIYQLNLNLLKSKLNNTFQRKGQFEEKGTILTFPNEDGLLEKFYVNEASIMEKDLQDKYSAIRSYIGKGIDNPNSMIRFSITTLGLKAIILNESDGVVYIDPYTSDKAFYIVYSKESLPQQDPFDCGTDNLKKSSKQPNSLLNAKTQNANDGYLRTFRLAIAATGEYSQWHLTNQGISSNAIVQVKKEAVLSAIVATMTIVNAVFERDIAIRLVLNANITDIIFLDPSTDNLTNNDKYKMLDESFGVINNNIGEANYDIGHVFAAENLGGVAYLRAVCSYYKPGGVSGMSPPQGSNFENIIIHEIGHQFGATHTFNGNAGSCDGNRTDETAVEPGSGSTIMSYAGNCSPQNVVNYSDRNQYFHIVNIRQMWNYITLSYGTCGNLISKGNSPPTIETIPNYTIPISTPFILKAIATDSNGDQLTYAWEQLNNEVAIAPPVSSATVGPAFRSLPPNTSSSRYFPNLNTVINGNLSNTWEVLPAVGRTMKFGVTVRDNNINVGQTNSKETTITFDSNSGPFKVTSQSSSTNWVIGTTQTITWDVGNTNSSPINCLKVNILFSTDGGFTYPITLSSNVNNDGSQEIVVPNLSTGGGRIKIESLGNVFYAISNGYVKINFTGRTFVPDNNFEQILINKGYDDVLDDHVLTSNIQNVEELIINSSSIANLKGIEDFKSLKKLDCRWNDLNKIDLSENNSLELIWCNGNQLTELKIVENSKLINLSCQENKLKYLDLSKAIYLQSLSCSSNNLFGLDLSNNNELNTLFAQNNPFYCIKVNQSQLNNIPTGWNKDNLTTYNLDCLVSDDLDSDGVKNDLDLCSRTPIDEKADINGCSPFQKTPLYAINPSPYHNQRNVPINTLLSWSNGGGATAYQIKFGVDGVLNNRLVQSDTIYNPGTLEYSTTYNWAILARNSVDNIGGWIWKFTTESYEGDTDSDGVINGLDQCPKTPIGESVNSNGCSQSESDDDGDGIMNYLDTCPNTSTGETVNANGCATSQLDTDNDGVKDNLDICPNTPVGETVNVTGCATSQLDTDGDGVKDNIDTCSNTPAGQSVNANGCSTSQLDTDNDGVKDNLDTCPNTPVGESVNSTGCSSSQLDSDNDVIKDNLDTCPNTPAGESVNSTGCSQSQIDDDIDGVMNNIDTCPNTPSGQTVNANGCSTSQLDTDNDGVKDNLDTCPNTPVGESVNSIGCSQSQIDDDGDSVMNNLDTCPNTPAGENVNTTGCSTSQLDTDNDSIKDNLDTCPNTPAGQAVNATGCSSSQLDADNDGIKDNLDTCPNTPAGESVNATGCSSSQLDTDSDGIKDNLDTCPNTPTGENVNATGCSTSQLDTDNDGIKDNLDICPNTPTSEVVNATGCSTSQLDTDNDGIKDNLDTCPNSPVGQAVNANGCFFLPANNFSIEVISETCTDKNNGKISISAQATHNYVATINGANHNFTNNNLSVSNLAPGIYNICIKITGITFEQCFTITVAEGKTVSGKSSETSNKTSIDISEGTAPYNVFINGINVLNTLSPSFMLDVRHGDLVEVKTAVLCEGVFSKTIDLFVNIKVYPNPTKGIFEITMPFSEKEVYIELFTVGSQLISKGTYQVANGKVQLNLENKPTGVYVVKIYLDKLVSLTIIKE